MVYTRKEYMRDSQTNGPAAHRRYYGQFVNSHTISRVINAIGKDRILSSTNLHFNDIPLKEWDSLVRGLPVAMAMQAAGDYYTISSGVCIAKEAAKQWKEWNK